MIVLLRPLEKKDLQTMSDAFKKIGWNKSVELFEKYFNEQESGSRLCFVAIDSDDNNKNNENFAGYVTLLNKPRYEFFAKQNVPEISDLNVLPEFRNKGIGTFLIAKCEEVARKEKRNIGLGVGLTSDYANALSLYLKLGYKFDKNGIAYCGKTLAYNQSTVVDDELNMYLIKTLL